MQQYYCNWVPDIALAADDAAASSAEDEAAHSVLTDDDRTAESKRPTTSWT